GGGGSGRRRARSVRGPPAPGAVVRERQRAGPRRHRRPRRPGLPHPLGESMNVEESVTSLKAVIRDVPDFPKPGILFKDITTLLKNPKAFRRALDLFTVLCGDHLADKVVAIESRGFIVGAPLADRLGLGFVPLRKPGKLPGKTMRPTYTLEYGEDCLAIHYDAVTPGERV